MTRSRFPRTALFAWMAAASVTPAAAQVSTATLSANVSAVAKLTLSTASVTFADADPDAVPQVPATGGPLAISAKARARPGTQVVLTVLAVDDFRSGLDVLPASYLTWTASGSGFVAGTLSKTTPVQVATWTGSGVHSGTQQLFFRNLWTHPRGTYTLSMVYTLSAP